MPNTEKIQKVMARNGIASRRESERLISAGRVTLNGLTAKLGDRMTATDKLALDGRVLSLKATVQEDVLLYHKPEGELCTRDDPQGRDNVFMSLPEPAQGRWVLVGRLDINTSGLLLLTTHGELAHRLMHPSYQIEREYAVRVLGEPTAGQLQLLQDGVKVDDFMAKFTDIERMHTSDSANQWYRVVILEGRQREVRRLWEAVGLKVSRLIRIRFGPIQLPRELRKGKFTYLDHRKIELLKQKVGL